MSYFDEDLAMLEDQYPGLEELKPIVAQIRAASPTVSILVPGDAGFCRDDLLTWCE